MATSILQQQLKVKSINLAPPVHRLIYGTQVIFERRRPLISFPERPSLDQRYAGKETVKAINLFPPKETVQSINLFPPKEVSSHSPQITIPQTNSPTVQSNWKEAVFEETVVKANNVTVVFTDILPPKYKRSVISEEEIEYIMRGGRD